MTTPPDGETGGQTVEMFDGGPAHLVETILELLRVKNNEAAGRASFHLWKYHGHAVLAALRSSRALEPETPGDDASREAATRMSVRGPSPDLDTSEANNYGFDDPIPPVPMPEETTMAALIDAHSIPYAVRRFMRSEISAGKLGELLGLEPGELHDFKMAVHAFDEPEETTGWQPVMRDLLKLIDDFGIQDADDWVYEAISEARALVALPAPPAETP